MNILLIHNKYQQTGGEDVVFEMEYKLLSSNGQCVETLVFDNHDIGHWTSKFLTATGLLYNVRSARIVEKKIESFKPDIIHVHNFFPLASPSILFKAKRLQIPVVVTLHNFRLICPSGYFLYQGKIYERSLHSWFALDAIVKGVYRDSHAETAAVAIMTAFHNLCGTWKTKVDKFIVLSDFAKSKFKESKVDICEEQFVVKPNFAEDCGVSDLPRENFYLYVGRLSEEKGIVTLLKAAAEYKFNLIIAGDGPLRGEVREYASNHPNICWLGFQSKPVIVEHLKRCRALIIPSVCYEGFPLSLLEAFSAGTPVIASRLGSLVEIILDGRSGFHFKAGDANDLYSKIILLERNTEAYKEMCSNARQTYLWNYTPEKNYRVLMSIYNSVLENQTISDSRVLKTTTL